MRRKIFFLFVIVLSMFVVLSGVFLACKKKAPEKMLIAFDSLSDQTVDVLQTLLKEQFQDIEQQFDWRSVPSNQSLSEFIKEYPQTAVVFTADNRNLFDARNFLIRHDAAVFQNLPSTFQNSFFNREKAEFYAFPLLINPVKLAYIDRGNGPNKAEHIRLFTIEDIEALCAAAKKHDDFPFVCAGGDDEQLFAFMSAVAAMLGLDISWEECTLLQETMDLHVFCPPALKTVLEKLVVWRRQEFLHPEWFRLIDTDIEIFMQFKPSVLVCMPFSASRRLKNGIQEGFKTLQIPLPDVLEKKNMAAEIIVYAQTEQKSDIPAVNAIRDFFYLQETNELLARRTGFAPVFSTAQTQDSEASSGRYWVAASNKALPFFGNIVCTDSETKKRFAAAIRQYLEVNGVGY